MRLLRARGSAELREVAFGSATQALWLRNGEVGSQESAIDQSRLAVRRTIGEVRRGGRRASDRAERVREEQVVCHASALAMTDEARREAEM